VIAALANGCENAGGGGYSDGSDFGVMR